MMRWIQFNEWCARRSTRGQIRNSNGIQATWSHSKLIINNLTTPTEPVVNAADLRLPGKAAVTDATRVCRVQQRDSREHRDRDCFRRLDLYRRGRDRCGAPAKRYAEV